MHELANKLYFRTIFWPFFAKKDFLKKERNFALLDFDIGEDFLLTVG